MNRRLEICGEAPAGMLTVIMPAVGIRIHVNGHTIGGSELAVLGLGAELNLTNITPVDGIMLNIPAALFESEHGLKLPTRGQILPIRGRPAAIECFKSSIWSAWQTGAAEAPPPADIVAEIATLMNGSRVPLADARCGEMGRWRVLQRARRYVDAHLTETVDVGDICKHTHVSLSTLERVFRQRLEMTPLDFIRARRLNAARAALVSDKACQRQISEIALGCGFSHLGRFSAVYRAHFGHLPSETRMAMPNLAVSR